MSILVVGISPPGVLVLELDLLFVRLGHDARDARLQAESVSVPRKTFVRCGCREIKNYTKAPVCVFDREVEASGLLLGHID